MTRVCKNVKVAANVELSTEGTRSFYCPEKLLAQQLLPAQRLRIILGNFFRAASAKFLFAKLRSSRSGASGGSA